MSDKEMMARGRAGELSPCFIVEPNDGVFRVPTVGSSDVASDVNVVGTKHYPHQSAGKKIRVPFRA